MTGFFQDLQYAVRGMKRSPGFTAAIIAILAFAIGANTAIFSLINTVLLRPLPVSDSDRLVVLWEDASAEGFAHNTPAPANYVDWKAQNETFDDIAAASWQTFNLTNSGEPERLTGLRVTANFLTLLGIKPPVGRLMLPTEDNPEANRVAVISHRLWQRHFGGDSEIFGRPINLNDETYVVIGVAPAGFEFPSAGADVWVAPAFGPRDLAQRGAHYLFVIGRLKTGVSVNQAQANMTTIGRRLEAHYPETNKGVGVAVVPMREHYVGDLSVALNLLLAAVGTLLLIASANLAHLFLARETVRQREIAMRTALGADRTRIVRALLTECAVFAVTAAVAGAWLSTATFGFLSRLIPEAFPEGTFIHFDWRVFAFTAGIAALTVMLFGAAPAFQATHLDLNAVLKQGGGKNATRASLNHVRSAVVVMQVAFSIVLLISAGLLVTSFVRIRGVNTGIRAENVVTVETALPPRRYVDALRRADFYQQVIERITKHPGVISAGYVNFPPLTMKGGTNGFAIEGHPPPRPGERPDANNRTATPDYLRTIGVPLLRGRYYDERDGLKTPRVVVINQTMARTYWPGEDALGARIRFGDGGPQQPPYTVVGIVGDVRQMSLDAPPRPEMYFPVVQAPGGPFFWPRTLVVRTSGDPNSLVPDIRAAIAEVDPNQPVANIQTMNDILDHQMSDRRIQTTVLTTFATSALLLTLVGLYGVLSYTVAQRTREIGVRMALGAQRTNVIALVLRQSSVLVVVGILLGLAGAVLVTRYLEGMLFGLTPLDPATFVFVSVLFASVATVASYIPARRAARIDPLVALRYE